MAATEAEGEEGREVTTIRGRFREALFFAVFLGILAAGYFAVVLGAGGVLVGTDYLLRQHLVRMYFMWLGLLAVVLAIFLGAARRGEDEEKNVAFEHMGWGAWRVFLWVAAGSAALLLLSWVVVRLGIAWW